MNSNIAFILIALTLNSMAILGQCEDLVLSPSKDAQVWSYSPTGGDRGTTRADVVAYEWTKNGIPTTKFGLIEFDLSRIPVNTTIDSALISLFYDPESPDQGHHNHEDSNEFYFYRLLGPWEESVSWNEVPQFTDINKVLVPASNSANQDYTDINITPLIQDMLNGPNSNFGMLIKLKFTEYYRRVVFASSEHPRPELRPTLRIVSSDQIISSHNTICSCKGFSVTPNLSNDIVTLNLNAELLLKKELFIFNALGQLIEKIIPGTEQLEIDVSNYADGYYYISIPCKDRLTLTFAVIR